MASFFRRRKKGENDAGDDDQDVGENQQLGDDDDFGGTPDGGSFPTSGTFREPDYSDPDLEGMEPVEDSRPNLNFDDSGQNDDHNPFADEKNTPRNDDGFGGDTDFGFGSNASDGGSRSRSRSGSSGSGSGSGSESEGRSRSGSGSSRGSQGDEFRGDSDMFGVDNFQKDLDHSESHGSLFHDEGGLSADEQPNSQSQPYRDNANDVFDDENIDVNQNNDGMGMNWNAENAEADMPDPEDHRAATGSSRDRSGRSTKMLLLIACLFCVGVGAGLAVVFLVQGGDDDNPSPRGTTAAPTVQPSRNGTNIFDPNTQIPTEAPSTFLPTATPTLQPISYAPTEETLSNTTEPPTLDPNSNSTNAPTLAPFNTTNSTETPVNITAPTIAPSVENTTSTDAPAPDVNSTLVPTSLENVTLAPSNSDNATNTMAPTNLVNASVTNVPTLSPAASNGTDPTESLPTVAPFAVGNNTQVPTSGELI